MESLDEDSIVKILRLVLSCKGLDDAAGLRILIELRKCHRFESQLRFAVYGNEEMMCDIKSYVVVLQEDTGSIACVNVKDLDIYASILS